jgi:hypothetical protein
MIMFLNKVENKHGYYPFLSPVKIVLMSPRITLYMFSKPTGKMYVQITKHYSNIVPLQSHVCSYLVFFLN